LGAAADLVGVTDYCARGAPAHALRVGGPKYPDVEAVLSLRPDLVLANREENRLDDVATMRKAGVEVVVTYPRRVGEVPGMVRTVGRALGRDAGHLAGRIETAAAAATRSRPAAPWRTVTLIWRKPWMAVGADTYADDVLAHAGFVNALPASAGRYPRLDAEAAVRARPEVVLLPSEPYAFADADLPAVTTLFPGAVLRFVDGELLTWHGPHTATALRTFPALARLIRARRR
jgi:ABC-type Fe3+-hydroxamate transport system substrate-binding protein